MMGEKESKGSSSVAPKGKPFARWPGWKFGPPCHSFESFFMWWVVPGGLVCHKTMAKPTKLFSWCSLLMATMFGFSSSAQLNDPDWSLWFPLYTCACVVNLVNWRNSSKGAIRHIAKVALFLGVFLFVKVVIEDSLSKIAGFWSLDLTERVVREKTGSALVIISMILHLKAISEPTDLKQRKKKNKIGRLVEYGMAFLVAFSYGLPFVFFVVQKGEMRF